MAQPYVTGPVSVWVNRAGEAPEFLGHGETAPTIQFLPIWVPFKCDLTGQADFDTIYSGETARISATLIRFNIRVLNKIVSRARSALFPNAQPGFDDPGMIGTCALAEGSAYTLYLLWGSGAKPVNNNVQNGVLGRGIRFRACIMDPETVHPGSATPLKVDLAWSAFRVFNGADQNIYGYGSAALYDTDVSAVTGLPLN